MKINEQNAEVLSAIQDITHRILSAMGKINGGEETEVKTTSWVFPNGEESVLKVTLAAVLEMLGEVANLINTETFTSKEYAKISIYMGKVINAIMQKYLEMQ